jgi:MmyB-like transcription regulator ligand binding domain
VPAIVMTARWDVIGWNCLANKIFRDYEHMAPDQRNLLRILLLGDTYKHDPAVYENMARRILSKFRVDYSQALGDPAFEELIAELSAKCPIFRRLWNSPEVRGKTEAVEYHPQLGGMTFEHSSYVPEGSPMLRVVIFVPYDAASAAKVAALVNGAKAPAPTGPRRARKIN